MVPLVTVPPDIARLDGDDVGVRIGDVDNDGTLDLLVITNDWLVQGETDPLVEALWSACARKEGLFSDVQGSGWNRQRFPVRSAPCPCKKDGRIFSLHCCQAGGKFPMPSPKTGGQGANA